MICKEHTNAHIILIDEKGMSSGSARLHHFDPNKREIETTSGTLPMWLSKEVTPTNCHIVLRKGNDFVTSPVSIVQGLFTKGAGAGGIHCDFVTVKKEVYLTDDPKKKTVQLHCLQSVTFLGEAGDDSALVKALEEKVKSKPKPLKKTRDGTRLLAALDEMKHTTYTWTVEDQGVADVESLKANKITSYKCWRQKGFLEGRTPKNPKSKTTEEEDGEDADQIMEESEEDEEEDAGEDAEEESAEEDEEEADQTMEESEEEDAGEDVEEADQIMEEDAVEQEKTTKRLRDDVDDDVNGAVTKKCRVSNGDEAAQGCMKSKLANMMKLVTLIRAKPAADKAKTEREAIQRLNAAEGELVACRRERAKQEGELVASREETRTVTTELAHVKIELAHVKIELAAVRKLLTAQEAITGL